MANKPFPLRSLPMPKPGGPAAKSAPKAGPIAPANSAKNGSGSSRTQHPMAQFMEKAVANKMQNNTNAKQGGNPRFFGSSSPKADLLTAGDTTDTTGGPSKKAPLPFNLHPKNTKKVSPKKGMSH